MFEFLNFLKKKESIVQQEPYDWYGADTAREAEDNIRCNLNLAASILKNKVCFYQDLTEEEKVICRQQTASYIEEKLGYVRKHRPSDEKGILSKYPLESISLPFPESKKFTLCYGTVFDTDSEDYRKFIAQLGKW